MATGMAVKMKRYVVPTLLTAIVSTSTLLWHRFILHSSWILGGLSVLLVISVSLWFMATQIEET